MRKNKQKQKKAHIFGPSAWYTRFVSSPTALSTLVQATAAGFEMNL